MSIYDYSGQKISPNRDEEFYRNCFFDYQYDENSGANYTVIRINKLRTDGSYQFPHVFAPNGSNAGTLSTLSMNMLYEYPLAVNAGIFYTNSSRNRVPIGTVIQNGVIIKEESYSDARAYILTIDNDGNLGYAANNTSGNTLIGNGIVSAVTGWAPCIIDYDRAIDVIPDAYNDQTDAQRQIIGQFGNGDYAIITCEGRSYDNSNGWTMDEAVQICKKVGLKFAFNLDGGGSTETVLGNKQINTIYENEYGRIVPTYIVFNGTTTFGDPH